MTTKYFKYAIGEIFLVVVGILIALSINNWNEARKDRIIELDLLEDMLTSLKQDRSLFATFKGRLDRKDSALNKALNLRKYGLEKAQVQSEELFSIFIGLRLSYDKGPYEALISAGLDKIRDKELRGWIIRYYQISLPRTEGFLNEVVKFQEDVSTPLSERLVDEGILKQGFTELDSGNWTYNDRVELDLHRLAKSDVFFEILKNEAEASYDYRDRLDDLIDWNKMLIQLLEKNLKD